MVYDLDGDGKAEVAMRTAPGTIDGAGNFVLRGDDNPNDDFRNSSGYILSGPEYLTVFSGESGAALATIPFEPARGSVSQWGDNYGNRVDRFLAAIAYLDGVRPSLIMARGYYGPQTPNGQARNEIAAYNFRDGDLTNLWHFRAGYNINGNINRNYIGQGNHNLSIADVDGDGRDEIIFGAAAIDDDGLGLYSTGLGHGDALHVSDMLPSRPGLEVFQPHESPSSYRGAGGEFRDARTGQLIFGIPADNDVGRGVAFDIDPNHAGYEMWATTNDPSGNPRMIYSSNGEPIYATPGNMFYNFGVWWDADPLRELLDGTTISDWNYVTRGRQNQVSSTTGSAGSFNNTSGLSSNNASKSTPALSADILGDWREEVIWRRSDNSALQIWTTAIPATNRIYTLMHDPKYRLDVAWQNVAYNQPPHPGFFLGAGMVEPPTPHIYTVQFVDLVGDYNSDGKVDAADYVVWRKAENSATGLRADGNKDGVVDQADYALWRSNFGNSNHPPIDVAARSSIAEQAAIARTDTDILHPDRTISPSESVQWFQHTVAVAFADGPVDARSELLTLSRPMRQIERLIETRQIWHLRRHEFLDPIVPIDSRHIAPGYIRAAANGIDEPICSSGFFGAIDAAFEVIGSDPTLE
jgi:rhamnogalacturonan endolyase